MAHWTTGDLVAAADLNDGFGLRQVVTFTSSGTFTKANYPWARHVRVMLVGGGGSGAGANTTGAGQGSCGGGGGAGGYAESLLAVGDLSANETVTVGSGGSATSGNGLSGGTTSFGAHVVAPGGSGGTRRNATSSQLTADGGAASTGSTGDRLFRGLPGGVGIILTPASVDGVTSGSGGASQFGGGGRGVTSNSAGIAGVKGSGGSGAAHSANQGSTSNSGAGGDGFVVVELYG